MYLALRSEHPNSTFIPTADILFAELCHIFRTKEYYEDVPENLHATDPLFLKEHAMYDKILDATERAWIEKFGKENPFDGPIPRLPWNHFQIKGNF